MENFHVISVQIVSGESLYPTWKSYMQKVKTDKGVFIDNAPGSGPFDSKWKSAGASPGYDWKSNIGETTTGIIREAIG